MLMTLMCSLAVVAHQHLRAGSVCGWMLPQTERGGTQPHSPLLSTSGTWGPLQRCSSLNKNRFSRRGKGWGSPPPHARGDVPGMGSAQPVRIPASRPDRIWPYPIKTRSQLCNHPLPAPGPSSAAGHPSAGLTKWAEVCPLAVTVIY